MALISEKMDRLLPYLPAGLLMETNCTPFVISFHVQGGCVKEIPGMLLRAKFECNICITGKNVLQCKIIFTLYHQHSTETRF